MKRVEWRRSIERPGPTQRRGVTRATRAEGINRAKRGQNKANIAKESQIAKIVRGTGGWGRVAKTRGSREPARDGGAGALTICPAQLVPFKNKKQSKVTRTTYTCDCQISLLRTKYGEPEVECLSGPKIHRSREERTIKGSGTDKYAVPSASTALTASCRT